MQFIFLQPQELCLVFGSGHGLVCPKLSIPCCCTAAAPGQAALPAHRIPKAGGCTVLAPGCFGTKPHLWISEQRIVT